MARETYADKLKAEAQRRLTQQTELTRSSIAPRRQGIENVLGQSRQTALGNVQNVLGQAGSQYGVTPLATTAGGQEFAGRETSGLQRKSAEALDRAKLIQMRNYFNQVYTTALQQYQNAGYTLEQANEFARQYAIDETDRAFQSERAEAGRQEALAKESLAEDISKSKKSFDESLDTGNPYMQAFIQSLTGLAGAGLTYGIATSGRTPRHPTSGSYFDRVSRGETPQTFGEQFLQRPKDYKYSTGFRRTPEYQFGGTRRA